MGRRWLYQAKAEPVLAEFGETITLDKWHQPPSQPVRTVARSTASLVAGLVLVLALPDLPLEGQPWQPIYPDRIVRAAPSRAHYPTQEFRTELEIVQPEAVDLRWWQQASEPVRTRPPLLPTPQPPDLVLEPTQRPEEVLLSKFWQQASEPVQRPKPAPHLYQSLFLDPFPRPPVEVPSVAAFMPQPPVPVRERRLTPAPASELTLTDAQRAAPIFVQWWRQPSEPILQVPPRIMPPSLSGPVAPVTPPGTAFRDWGDWQNVGSGSLTETTYAIVLPIDVSTLPASTYLWEIEAVATTSNATKPITVRLVNTTDGTIIALVQTTATTKGTGFIKTPVANRFSLPSGSKNYKFQFGGDTGGFEYVVHIVRLWAIPA